MAKVMMKATRLDPMNWRVRKSANSTIGAEHPELDRDECRQPDHAAGQQTTTIWASSSPSCCPRSGPRTIAVRLAVSATTPG